MSVTDGPHRQSYSESLDGVILSSYVSYYWLTPERAILIP